MSSITAVDIESWIRFGVAEPLSLGQSAGVIPALLAHAGEDEIAGAVEDALQGEDLIGGQALRQRGNDRNAAGHAGFEGDGSPMPAGRVKDLSAVLGEKRLVGRHHIFARRQQIENGLLGPGYAAD